MGATLVVGHGVNFIDNDGARRAQHAPRAFSRQQNEERFGCRDQNVGRTLAHLLAFPHGRVAGAHGGADGREENSLFGGQRGDFGERRIQILADIVAERFERRDVDDGGFIGKRTVARGPDEAVQADQERRERFAGSGGGGDQDVVSGADFGPSEDLRFGRS